MGGTALDTSVSLVRQVSRLCQGFRLVSFELRKPHWYSDHCVAWLHNRDLSMSGCCSRGRTAWGRGGGQVHSPEGVWFLTLALCGAELWTSFAWQLHTNGPVSKLTFCFTMQLTALAPNNGNDKWKIKCCTFLWEMQFLGKLSFNVDPCAPSLTKRTSKYRNCVARSHFEVSKAPVPTDTLALLSLLWFVMLRHTHWAVVFAVCVCFPRLSPLYSHSTIFSLWSQLSS